MSNPKPTRSTSVAGIVAVLAIGAFVAFSSHLRRGPDLASEEVRAEGTLVLISTSQTLFREGDKDQDGVLDYATLSELDEHALLPPHPGAGSGYTYASGPGSDDPEELWWAIAIPEPALRKAGARTFFTNHEGHVWASARRGEVTPNTTAAEPPAGWKRVR